MKILALSDPHFHAYRQHSTMEGGVNSRLLDVRRAMDQALTAAIGNEVDLITVSGDVFHVRGQIKPSVYNQAYNWFFNAVYHHDMCVAVIPGNHDLETATASYDHPLAPMGDLVERTPTGKGICCLIDSPLGAVYSLRGSLIGGIPYQANLAEFKERFVEMAKNDNPEAILIHQGIDDFDVEGVPATGLTAKWLLDNYDGIVLAGHYHAPGVAYAEKGMGKVVNVGAPLHHRLSDYGIDMGYWIVDTVDQECVFGPIHGPEFVKVHEEKEINADIKGDFVYLYPQDEKEAKKWEKKAKKYEPRTITTVLEKQFSTARETTIEVDTPRAMLAKFLDSDARYKPHQAELLSRFDALEVSDATA